MPTQIQVSKLSGLEEKLNSINLRRQKLSPKGCKVYSTGLECTQYAVSTVHAPPVICAIFGASTNTSVETNEKFRTRIRMHTRSEIYIYIYVIGKLVSSH